MTETALVPTVGMGITVSLCSDRYAGTIERVSPSGRTVWFRRDTATPNIGTDGYGPANSEFYNYSYEPNPHAPLEIARHGKRGWKSGGNRVTLNVRSEYYDPSF